jgi:DNA-binding MarR family transcriptional regulator
MAAISSRKRSTTASVPSRLDPRPPRRTPLTVSRPELLTDGNDKEFRQLVHNLFGFLMRHERIRSGHAKVIGLAGIEYTVLISIAHLSVTADVNVKTVADHLHLSGAFMTSVTRRLLQLGLIHKTTDPADRRRVTLTVSQQGLDALEALAPVQRSVNDVEFKCLTRDEFRSLSHIIERLIASSNDAIALQAYLTTGLNPPLRDGITNQSSGP